MPEKLTLTRYLQGRGEVKALTHIEALAFGVPYPLQPGWPAKYGAMEITEGMIEDLKARILTAKESTAGKARRGLEGIGGAVVVQGPAAAQHPHDLRPPATQDSALSSISRSAQFHGFTLRQARRYRRHKPAPWA